MLRDLRAVWTEDQYQILGPADKPGSFYFARQKGDSLQVFIRSAASCQRQLVQNVQIDGDEDLYWCSSSQKMVSEEPLHGEPVARHESLLVGYRYNEFRKTIFEDLTSDVQIMKSDLGTGAEVIWLLPKNAKKWILSLHGGPESNEGLELRYGGLYRDLLKNNKAIAILNYRGSSGLAPEISQSSWGRWKEAFLEDFEDLCKGARVHSFAELPESVFGVSFGGSLALLLRTAYSIEKTVLSSPLLDLSFQWSRASAEFQEWFVARFSSHDRRSLGYEHLCKDLSGNVHVLYSKRDAVLGTEMFARLESDKEAATNWSLYKDDGGHAPTSYRDCKKRFQTVFDILK
jgi:pimeloyl-ACP methyl ester carboxylesterase